MTIFDRVWKWLRGLRKKTLAFTKNLLVELSENPDIQELAITAVRMVEKAALEAMAGNKPSSIDKFKQARDLVIDGLKIKGLPVLLTAIDGAIVSEVANMNAGKK